jgi:hypothetical protein
VAAKISKDEGRSWSEEFHVVNDLALDVGYPSSVQLSDGRILTVYYSGASPSHYGPTREDGYHMGTVIWNLPNY